MSHDAFQFYPTPAMLAIKAWHMFDKGAIRRVLEPSAGRGDLLEPLKERTRYSRVTVDTIELNIAHHPTLREKGYRVIDTDFLNFQSPVGYSHIVLNPPFHAGVDHVLHAWDILRDGQIVAILNAETIDNPYSAKRKQLVRLIEQFGRVEYVRSAFQDPDTLRKTDVRVALIHLKKKALHQIRRVTFTGRYPPGIDRVHQGGSRWHWQSAPCCGNHGSGL